MVWMKEVHLLFHSWSVKQFRLFAPSENLQAMQLEFLHSKPLHKNPHIVPNGVDGQSGVPSVPIIAAVLLGCRCLFVAYFSLPYFLGRCMRKKVNPDPCQGGRKWKLWNSIRTLQQEGTTTLFAGGKTPRTRLYFLGESYREGFAIGGVYILRLVTINLKPYTIIFDIT